MAMINMLIFTSAERTEAMTYNVPLYQVDPRAIDTVSPGVGINLNGEASNYDVDDEVPLTGKYVANKSILDNSSYPQNMRDYLVTLPFAILNTDNIFIPEE